MTHTLPLQMIFYKSTLYFISSIFLPTALLLKDLEVTRSGSLPASICKIGLEFFAELNNTSDEDYHAEFIPDECCLKVAEGNDCDSLQIIGECSEVIPKETSKTLTLVAPLIDPFERTGFCTIHVDSRPIDRKRKTVRETLSIHFDTRVKETPDIEELHHCKNIDEDPLNDCKPVNCETYYNGRRSYFDKQTKRCTDVPSCVDRKRNHSNQVYDPNRNRCVDEESINNDDIDFIKSLTAKERHAKDILILNSVNKPSKPHGSYSEEKKPDTTNFKLNVNEKKVLKSKSKTTCHSVVQYILTNKYTMIVLALVVTVQCCLIITMVYCLMNNSCCCNKKKVVRKFFNYRQDASMTTPLIGTSNIHTDTKDFDYKSESSNIDKKIKCYKSCQREAKISMSDDILLKCLNRRDWSSKPKSEETTEKIETEIKTYKHKNEIEDKTCKEKPLKAESRLETSSALIEKEIQCHDYNFTESRVDFDALDQANVKNNNTSITTDKGAQANFSNDSMDDFLSERGMFFQGDTLSSSTSSKSSSELTSKTSKNNIIRNVLSFLTRSKKSTLSDPGVKKSSKNLELLHISQASVFSSSFELKNPGSIRLVKESRSTFYNY